MQFVLQTSSGVRPRRSVAFAATITAMVALLSGGCGGGGNDQAGSGAGREAAVATVRGVRGAALQIEGSQPPSVGAATRLQDFHFVIQNGRSRQQTGEVFRDETYGLWAKLTVSDDGKQFRIDYFQDQAATRVAGFYAFQIEGDPETYPYRIRMNFDITAGPEAAKGNALLTQTSADAGTLESDFTDVTTGDRIRYRVTFGLDSFTDGEITLDSADGDFRLKNISGQGGGGFTAQVEGDGLTGSLTIASDDSGTLTLRGGDAGETKATWDADGKGMVRLPDGTTEQIADFDTE